MSDHERNNEGQDNEKVVCVAGRDHADNSDIPKDIDREKVVCVIGHVNPKDMATITDALIRKGFEVYGEEECKERMGKDILMVGEGDHELIKLLNQNVLEEVSPKTIRPEKPVEPWRVKKGRFKGHFPRYR